VRAIDEASPLARPGLRYIFEDVLLVSIWSMVYFPVGGVPMRRIGETIEDFFSMYIFLLWPNYLIIYVSLLEKSSSENGVDNFKPPYEAKLFILVIFKRQGRPASGQNKKIYQAAALF
jgi:hypothetical protein